MAFSFSLPVFAAGQDEVHGHYPDYQFDLKRRPGLPASPGPQDTAQIV